MNMLRYYHSNDLDYSIGDWNEDTEEFDYSNELDVQDGHYEVYIQHSLEKKTSKKDYHYAYNFDFGIQGEERKYYVYFVQAKNKLEIKDGKFCAKQLSKIASQLKKRIKYWGHFLDSIEVIGDNKLLINIGS